VFNTDEDRQLATWLEQAGSGPPIERDAEVLTLPRSSLGLEEAHQLGIYREELVGETLETVVDRTDDAIRLIFVDEMESDVLQLSTGQCRELAKSFRLGLRSVEESPPFFVPDLFVGRVVGLSSSGDILSLGVEVIQGVSRDDENRSTLDFLGTWFLDDSTTESLTNGLMAAAHAVISGADVGRSFTSLSDGSTLGGEQPWLSVSTVRAYGGRIMVRLRLWDELVADRGDDGIIDLAVVDARSLAGFLLDGRRHAEMYPAYLFTPPEPFPREIITAQFEIQGSK
jgi:hypothetical protein